MSWERIWDNKLIRSADKGGHWTTKMGSMSWYILVNLGLSHEARRPCGYLPDRKIGGQPGAILPPMEEVLRVRVGNTRHLPTRGDRKNWDIVYVK